MIVARVIRVGFEPDLIGLQEFPVLPSIGTTIEVLDRNSNMHRLEVTNILIQGIKFTSDNADLQRALIGDNRILIFGRPDRSDPFEGNAE